MFKKIVIKQDERGLLYRDGSFLKHLGPGTYRFSRFTEDRVEVMNIGEDIMLTDTELAFLLQDEQLAEQLSVIEVQDHEVVLHYENGRFVSVLTAGKHAFWNVLKKHTYVTMDTTDSELTGKVDAAIMPRLAVYYQMIEVGSHETAMLFYNNIFQRQLGPGKYYFWRGAVTVSAQKIDLRQQQLDMTGQEMMTEDKVTLRLNFVCQYKIVNPMKVLEIKSLEEQIYIQLQLILREYVGTLKLDDLLRMKQDIGSFVLDRLQMASGDYGVQFLSAGLKDIILPGDIKDILNTVLLAEKKAQANLITRREETASTRSLLNTAKLMDENETLYRLKELEFMEKLCEKIGTISLTGGDNVLGQLQSLLGGRAAES